MEYVARFPSDGLPVTNKPENLWRSRPNLYGRSYLPPFLLNRLERILI